MTVARRLTNYLEQNHAAYDIVFHPYSEGALKSARNACIPIQAMVKAIMLRDDRGLILAAIPAGNRLMLRWINEQQHRHFRLAGEYTVLHHFDDCEPGAIPAFGAPWGMTTVCDSSFDIIPDLYLESGNHRELIHMTRDEYLRLIGDHPRSHISCSQDDRDGFAPSVIPSLDLLDC